MIYKIYLFWYDRRIQVSTMRIWRKYILSVCATRARSRTKVIEMLFVVRVWVGAVLSCQSAESNIICCFQISILIFNTKSLSIAFVCFDRKNITFIHRKVRRLNSNKIKSINSNLGRFGKH